MSTQKDKILLIRHLGRITSWLKAYMDSIFGKMESENQATAAQINSRMEELNQNEAERERNEADRQAAETRRNNEATEMLTAERQRSEDEALRVHHEQQRIDAEQTRASAEYARRQEETTRIESEAGRQSAETARTDAEAVRDSSEKARVTAESERTAAEKARLEAENARQAAEELRASAETARVDAEALRISAENTRTTAEQHRAAAESRRASAEEARVEAERERAAEFESWQTELDGKPDRTDLSNILGNDTEGRIEEIEPGIVTEALRKVPQLLTPEEQAVVKNNIGVSKMELFCDLFSNAAGSFGYARLTDGEFDCELNGLKLSYEEAILIYNITNGAFTTGNCRYVGIRTNLWNVRNAYGSGALNDSFPSAVFYSCSKLEIARISHADEGISWSSDWFNMFTSCVNLRKVLGTLGDMSTRQNANCFHNCVNLEEIKIHRLNVSFNISTCPKINCESVRYWIENRSTTNSLITITVHPDVYAKLTDENNTEWHQLLLDAAAKQITFATV